MKARFLDQSGNPQVAELSLNLYQAAHDAGMTIDAYLAQQYPTDENQYGSVMGQMFASAGLYAQNDPKHGIRAATVRSAFDGTADREYQARGSSNVADAIPASRILFPAFVLSLIEDQLYGGNRESDIALFDTMVAIKETIAGNRFEYPVLDYTRPSQARSSRTSQMAEPNLMMTLTASDKQGYVPAYSLGLQISDEAAKSQTIDFVALSLSRQAQLEAADRLDEIMKAMVEGDTDAGFSALTPVDASTLDSAATGGTITHKAWLKWLALNRRKMTIDYVWMTLDTFLKLEARTDKPLKETDSTDMPFKERPDIIPSLLNLSIGPVKVMIVESSVVADDTIVGLDSRYAIRKITNSEAEYRAAEQLVMRKASQMRWDWGYTAHRLYDDAWSVLDFS